VLHTDIPTRDDIVRLATARDRISVSVYLPTSPNPNDTEASRMSLKHRLFEAVTQLEAAGEDKRRIALLAESIQDLIDHAHFWDHLSYSLAVFATPESTVTFRLPNRLEPFLEVSDRFAIKPLMRAVTFPQAAFVLALAQNSVRLIEVTPESEGHDVEVPDLPKNAEAFGTGGAQAGLSTFGYTVHGLEGEKVRIGQFARAIDRALRPVLAGRDLPLILASTEPLDGVYRAVNTYAHIAADSIQGNPEKRSNAELAAASRGILDAFYEAELVALTERMASQAAHGRAVPDLSDVARSVTYGAVDTLVVDIDAVVPGLVDEKSGAILFSESENAVNYDVLDEIVRRAILTRATVYAVRADEVPGGGPVAASVRFPV